MSETITLLTPVEFGDDKVITEITLQEPTIADLEAVDKEKGEVTKMIKMISICSGLTPPEVRKIRTRDLKEINAVLGKYLPADPETGES